MKNILFPTQTTIPCSRDWSKYKQSRSAFFGKLKFYLDESSLPYDNLNLLEIEEILNESFYGVTYIGVDQKIRLVSDFSEKYASYNKVNL